MTAPLSATAARLASENHATARGILQRNYAHIREPILAHYNGAVGALLRAELERLGLTPEANARLHERHRQLQGAKLSAAWDEARIRQHAENYSRICGRIRELEARESFARYIGIEPPAGRTMTPEGRAKRLADPLWWRRALRKRWTRSAENAMRDLGVIRRGREPYATEAAVRHRAAGKRRARQFLEASALVNESTGEQLDLLPVAERSLANPALRRGEFMCRVRGFEEIANAHGHVAEFVTLTAPSAFHAQLAAGGTNPTYQRATVRAAQAWLCRMWARARARLKRLSVMFYGFRIAEPHHDATPHWHLLLFCRAHDAETLRTLLRKVWLSDYSGELGAGEHRCKFQRTDREQGSAVGYVAKYVSKNIDGAGAIGAAEDSETGGKVLDGIARVDAWASLHGIRQFQQVGGPPVGLWREARRIREPVADVDIERARSRADRGDWAGFVRCVGGVAAGRKTNIKLERVESGDRNRYGEHRPARVIGLRCASAVAVSRPHRWRLVRRCAGAFSSPFSHLGPVAITVRGAPGAGEPDSWSNPRETSTAGPM